jgi:hypothetical protein
MMTFLVYILHCTFEYFSLSPSLSLYVYPYIDIDRYRIYVEREGERCMYVIGAWHGWRILAIPTLGKLKQEDDEFEATWPA